MQDRPPRSILRISLIIAGAFCLYLIGNGSVSLWDRDEPRYAQTSRQMLQSGDWVVPRLLDQVRTAKPVFIYWCQTAAMKLFGDTTFSTRLPSAIAMALTLIVLAVVIGRTIGMRRALLTVLVMSTAGLSIAAAKMCLTDSVLLLFITTAQLCLGAIYLKSCAGRSGSLGIAILMWIAIGFAGLTKGPVVLGVQLATIIVLAIAEVSPTVIADWKNPEISWRRKFRPIVWWKSMRPIIDWKQIHPIIGLLIVAAICAPWLYLIHQREPTFLPTIIGHDVIERARSGLEGHTGPPGYYLMLIWGTFFPWSLLLPAAMVSAWRNRHIPHIRFALAAVIGPWIMFELYGTKLPHYVLPTFPALALLTADMLIRAARKKLFADRVFLRIVLGWGCIVVLISLAPWALLDRFTAPSRLGWVAMILLPILAVEYGRSIYVHFRAARPTEAATVMGVGMMILIAVIYGMYLPNVPYLQISPQVAEVLKAEGATHPGDAIMIDYKETSLAFYQGGTIRPEREDTYLQTTPPWNWPKWIVLSDEIWKQTPELIQQQFTIVSTVHGWNYADGGLVMDVLVLRKRFEPPLRSPSSLSAAEE